MWVGPGDPGPLPSHMETQEGAGRQPHGPACHPGAAWGWHLFATPFCSLWSRSPASPGSLEMGPQGGGGAGLGLRILPGAAGKRFPLPRAAPLLERGEGPGPSTRLWGQSPAPWHIPTPRGPSSSEARCSPKLGRSTQRLLSGRPIYPRLHHLALITPGGPCPGPPGPGTMPQGTCRASGRGGPGPHRPWVPSLCLPGQTPPWAPAPSLCPRQRAPGGCLSLLSQKVKVPGRAFRGSRWACGGRCCEGMSLEEPPALAVGHEGRVRRGLAPRSGCGELGSPGRPGFGRGL